MFIRETVYLDYQASTPVDPQVAPVMLEYFLTEIANPHADHALGWHAAAAVERATGQIAGLIGADPDEIVFCSGATEANNMAMLGFAARAPAGRRRILVSAIEHKCVLAAARAAAHRYGCSVEVIRVDAEGRLDLADLAQALREDVLLVSLMAVNNEIGTVQPLDEVCRLAGNVGALVHSDGVQAPSSIDFDVRELGVDAMSLSGHKIYGPKGIGALYIKRDRHSDIEPLIYGGGQQNGLRAGTVPVPLCAGFGKAAEMMQTAARDSERIRIGKLRDQLESGLGLLGDFVQYNCPRQAYRHPGNLNVRFDGLDARDILGAAQPFLAASTGSACTSGIPEPSHVLRAIGLTADQANASIRFGIGRFTTAEQIDRAVEIVTAAVAQLL